MTPNDTHDRIIRNLARKIDESPGIGLTGLTKVTPGLNRDDRGALLTELIATGRYEQRTVHGRGAARHAYYPVKAAAGAPAASADPFAIELAELAAIERSLTELACRTATVRTRLGELQAKATEPPTLAA